MATGDQNDIFMRLKSLLPANWWQSGQTPVLDAMVSGIAAIKSQVYAAIAYTTLQARITTSSDGWLDITAADFFGNGLLRRQNQSDASYRALILASLFRERATRNGIRLAAQAITGNTPTIIELNRPADTGAYSAGPIGYGAGAYSSQLPQYGGVFIVKVARPSAGSLQYGAQDTDIYSTIDGARPAAATAWVWLQ